jgi:hypothetical protein
MRGPDEITRRLEVAGIDYCIVGGLASIAYGRLRQRLTLGSGEAWFATPESVIVNKLLYYREGGPEKHLDDIRAMIAGGNVIRQADLQTWIEKFGLEKQWDLACCTP